ncbi:MAG: NUDIX domain-containing protein [Alphaproteobacteria bacterium]|nr:NUDIX domain-containing protein [Alphaproteobacteria bacterium]MCB9690774.1 NUDIX domain-containing protein [Alphaproteobacteria bacterium]
MRALITAGGTSEPIDDVRVVTNLSSGRFGARIANALVARGVDVTVLGSRSMLSHPDWLDPRVRPVPFGSFRDLQGALAEHAPGQDLVLMAAAVSDYSPVPADGKIRSDADEIVIRMRRNPKLLPTLRDLCGDRALVVGFKLLSGVSRDELVEVARGQLRGARLDLTVANDLRTFVGSLHPVVLVEDDRTTDYSGTKEDTAAFVADRVLELQRARSGEVREGASFTLFHRASGEVLVGRRLTGPSAGCWSVPGGRVEPGEGALDAARRELREEVGLGVPEGPPLARVEVVLPGDPPWRIAGFVAEVQHRRAPRPSEEIEASWMPLADALALEPVTPGLSAVLQRVRHLLAQPTVAGADPPRL